MIAAPNVSAFGLIALIFGLGLPLGTPPEPENPIMAYAAPVECVLYATWAGMAAPNPASPNQTEQLLAEPEVKQFAAALEKAFASLASSLPQGGGDPAKSARLAQSAPLVARTFITRPGAIFLTKLAPAGNSVNLEGGLILHAGDAADAISSLLTDALTSPAAKPAETTIAGRKFLKLAAQEGRSPQIVWGSNNGYLMIGLGAGAIEGLSTRIAARQEPAWLTQVKANLPVQRRSSVAYVNVKQLVDTFAPLGGPQADTIIAALGLKQVKSLQMVSGLDQTGIVNRSLLAYDGPPRGLLALAESGGITAADLKHIPADALMAACFSFDAAKTLQTAFATIGEVDPKAGADANQALAQFSQQAGIDLRAATAALGSRWTLHASSADGGWLGAALTVEVKDAAQLQNVEKTLIGRFLPPGAPPEMGRITRTPFAWQTIAHWVPPQVEMSFLQPSWCVTDKRLIVGLNAQAVKAVLSRQPAEKSLADVPEVAALLAGKDPLLSLQYYDTAQFFDATYMYAQILLPVGATALQRQGVPIAFDAAQLPPPRTISRHLRPSVSVIRRTKLGLETETQQTLPGMNVGASAPVAVALLLPAVQAAREAARRMQSGNNLKQQALGLMNFHDVYQTYPAAYSSNKEGKPLLSWRVHILPFLEQKALYDQFHLDEPWDSEHNKPLIAKMPPVYRSPNSAAGPGLTTYLGVGGERGPLGAPLDKKNANPGNGLGMSSVIDGTSNTALIVEANDAAAVIWTKPEEWKPDEKDPFKGLLGVRPTGFLAVFCDGHTQLIQKSMAPEMLKRVFMRDDGMQIEFPEDR